MSPPSPPEPIYVIRGDIQPIHCLLLRITGTEEILFTGTENGFVHLWNSKIYRKITSFQCSDVSCLSLHFIGNYLLTQDKHCTLKIWQCENFSFSSIFEKKFNNPSFCKIGVFEDTKPDSTVYLAVPQSESSIEIYIFRVTDIEIVCTLKYDKSDFQLGQVSYVKIFRHDIATCLAAVYEDGTLLIWQLPEAILISFHKLTNNLPMSFDFDSVTLQGVCGTVEKLITFFKLDSHLQVTKCKNVEITNPGVGALRIRPDRKIVAAGCWDGRLRIFSWKTCKLLAVLDYHRGAVLDVNFSILPITSSKTQYLLTASASDENISFWRIYE